MSSNCVATVQHEVSSVRRVVRAYCSSIIHDVIAVQDVMAGLVFVEIAIHLVVL